MGGRKECKEGGERKNLELLLLYSLNVVSRWQTGSLNVPGTTKLPVDVCTAKLQDGTVVSTPRPSVQAMKPDT